MEEASRTHHMTLLLRELRKWAPDIDTGACALLLAGDLNTSPKWETVPIVRATLSSVFQDHAAATYTDREITIYMPHTQDVLDYTFHNKAIRPTEVLVVPGERDIVAQSLKEVGRVDFSQLPIPSCPSDHIPMCARFVFDS